MFLSFYSALNNLYADTKLIAIPNRLFAKLKDPSQAILIGKQFYDKKNPITILFATIPGIDCTGLGFRAGATLRFIFDIAYDD